MATIYIAGPGSEVPANPLRTVASRTARAHMSSKGLIVSGVYHASTMVRTAKSPSGDLLLTVERRVPDRQGWSTPDDFGVLTEE